MDPNVKKYKFYCLDVQHCTAPSPESFIVTIDLVKLEFSVYGKDIVHDYRLYFSILTVFSRVFEMMAFGAIYFPT